ncbi:MAG TPA: UDP-N-acetylmuramoyl-tripeptide--D-alanyl-D-alanine ligase [Methylomirabilota bacterium]|jgi:UDP-N-acetylmuramoyl-tripeptide--D-alanyl-D-alanine ligase|nr:UDP-N-acetylmuramoyl-tripeptide--D-alanyl-D-alanine ligase [Methylomirabilota bacterium]
MPRLTLAELVRGTQGALVGGRLDTVLTGVSIDSRTCAPGEAFFAIRGAHQDGHAFVAHARARGAACAVTSQLPPGLGGDGSFPLVLVDDTTAALQRLGAAHRRQFAIPVVAVTGSNGKTTTKELIATVLSARKRVLKPAGSYNNQWGVPLTLLQLEPEHEAAVLELGMNAFGEIASLAQLCQPTVGVVTTIAPAHLQGVGSLEGVQKAKGELVEAIPPGGAVVLNADDPLVRALAGRARTRVLTYGQADGADVRLGDVALAEAGLVFRLVSGSAAVDVRLPLAGRHNAWHAAAAATVGLTLGVPLDEAAVALALAAPVKGRLVWREAGGVRVLDDTYNANPASMRAALETLREAGGPGRCFAVLGDMLELGDQTDSAHREVGLWVAAVPLAGLAAVGPAMRATADSARAAGCPDVETFDAPEAAAAFVAERLAPGDRVLVKGSRGVRMERAVDALLARLAAARAGARC